MIQKVALFFVILSSFGCLQPIKIPIDAIHYDYYVNDPNTKGPRILFVYLPGRGDPMTAFQKEGLIEMVRERGLPADMIAVNAHMGYYLSGTVFTRLKEDVIEPAKTRGYDQIWLVGNSLGGYGSISYDREYPGDITGVVLLGPFLGRRDIINEIKQSGGIACWNPVLPGEKDWELHWEKKLWLWLKDCVQQEAFWHWARDCEQNKRCYPKIYLGYGRHDRFSYSQEFLASFMPPEHVIVIDGGHDWPTWKKLWGMFLNKNIFNVKTDTRNISIEVIQ